MADEAAGPSEFALRVMTLNLMGRQEDWRTRQEAVATRPPLLRPDVVCLQDVVVDEVEDQAAELFDDTFQLVHQANRAADGSGVSIASRWPISRLHEIDLRVTARAPRPFRTRSSPRGSMHRRDSETCWSSTSELRSSSVRSRTGARSRRGCPIHRASGRRRAGPRSSGLGFERRPGHGQRPLLDRSSIARRVSVCYQDGWEAAHRGEPEEAGHAFARRNPLVAAARGPSSPDGVLTTSCSAATTTAQRLKCDHANASSTNPSSSINPGMWSGQATTSVYLPSLASQ
jgi:hypothetical protein